MLNLLYAKIAGLVLILALALGLWHHNKSQNDLIATLRAELQDSHSKVKLQNEMVIDLQKSSDARLAAAKAELEAAKLTAETHSTKAKETYKAVPSVPSDSCMSALNLGNQE